MNLANLEKHSQYRQRLFPYTTLAVVSITKMESVYCAVRIRSLNVIQVKS